MSEEDLKEIKDNPSSNTIILREDEKEIINLFLSLPNEIGFSGEVIGKKYEAIKDYLQWNGFELKRWTPILHNMGIIWSNARKK